VRGFVQLQFAASMASRIIDRPTNNMPIYEYQCKKCGERLEAFLKRSDKRPTRCRKCGGRLEKLVSSPAIQFKGEGWYVTDYARKGRDGEKAEKEAPSSESTSSDKSSNEKDKTKKPSAKKTDKA
jgi:putative FmdB family regulatory protein